MFLAAEGDYSYVSQIVDTSPAAEVKTSAFPTAASVFGTPQQSVFSSTVPPQFQFGSSKPIKLQFGSQSTDETFPSPNQFRFGSSPSSSSASSDISKGKEAEGAKHKPPGGGLEKTASGPKARVHQRMFRRRRRSQSPVDEEKREPAAAGSSSSSDSSKELKAKEGVDEKSSTESTLEGKAEAEEEKKVPSEPAKPVGKQALSPAVAECQRAIYAAFLWQENLVYDAMASATFLKFCPELTKELRQEPGGKEAEKETEKEEEKSSAGGAEGGGGAEASPEKDALAPTLAEEEKKAATNESDEAETKPLLPPTLNHLVTFWDEISVKVTEGSSRPFPAPKVPGVAQELQSRYEQEKKEIEKRKKDKDKRAPAVAGGGSTACELCDQSFPDPVTYHMKDLHSGCGKHANGWGYNSRGTYCSGWAGNCGDGGRGGSTWYLLCKDCHARYMAMKDDAKKKTVKSVPLPKAKTRKPGKPRSLPVISATQGMIQNAKFLLEITRSCDSAPPTPQQKTPSVSEFSVGGSELLRQSSTPLVENVMLGDKPSAVTRELGADTANTSSEGTITDPAKRPMYLRSVSEAVKPTMESPQKKMSESSDDTQSVFHQQPPEELSTASDHLTSSLMLKPSRNLRQLIYKRSRSSPDNRDRGYRKVMAFVSSYHDLDGLRVSMKQSMRVAGVRAFAMEVCSDGLPLHNKRVIMQFPVERPALLIVGSPSGNVVPTPTWWWAVSRLLNLMAGSFNFRSTSLHVLASTTS